MVAINVLRGGAATRCRTRFGSVPKSNALQLLPNTASAEQWRTARRWRLGASELPTVCHVPGAYGSPFALWWAKVSGWNTDGTEEMQMGLRLEPVIAEVWQERNPYAALYRPGAALFGHPTLSWLCCTPDFLAVHSVVGEHGPGVISRLVAEPVECKAYDGGKGWGEPGTGDVPPHIAVQVQVQCAVLGTDRGHVVRMHGKRVTAYTVKALPLDGLTTTRGAAFVASLYANTPPALDASEATEEALGRLYADHDPEATADVPLSVAVDYRLALLAVKDATARKQLATNRLRQAMGTAGLARADGYVVAERRVGKRRGYTVPAGVTDGIYPKTKGLEELHG